jgi:hypothetical protein
MRPTGQAAAILRAMEAAYTGYGKNDVKPLMALLAPDFEFR